VFDRCEAARHVFIAIPCYTSTLQFDTAFALIDAGLHLKAAGIEVSMKGIDGNCYIDTVRNELVAHFLASPATDLLFWDADVGCLPQTVLKLAKATRPVVAAIYPKKQDDEEWPVNFVKGNHALGDEGLIEAKMVPTGLLRINRRVFDEMTRALDLPEYKARTITARPWFRTDIRDGEYYGEDVEFCRRWREMGGKIRVLPDETLSHTGPKAWIGNIGQSLRAGKF